MFIIRQDLTNREKRCVRVCVCACVSMSVCVCGRLIYVLRVLGVCLYSSIFVFEIFKKGKILAHTSSVQYCVRSTETGKV